MSRAEQGSAARLAAGMRRLLLVAAVLVALAGVQLFVFTERTETHFAWTIDPPLTAAFLGASYWASVVLEWGAARERLWANARIAVPTVFLSTTLTFVITLVHLDRFHLGAEFGAATRAVTWGWLVVYSTVPVIMLVVAWGQRKAGGTDPERVAPRPRAVRALVGAQAVLLGASGIGLLVAPTAVAPAWPWELTPLTGRAIGAWLIGLGVAAAHALWEDSPRRIRAAAWGFVAFALLQGWALGRYPGDVDWGRAPAVVYVAFLVSTLVTGLAALRLDRPAPVG